jgi:predicted dinucleotide-binding enzyme
MDLLVIGAGPVGRALARSWSAAGHAVTVAVRDPDDPKHDTYRTQHRLAGASPMLPTAEVTVLAVPGAQLPALLDAHGRRLDGRLLIDATNSPGGVRMHQSPLLSERLPGALVYRAFTTTGWENFTTEIAGERPDMLYAGPAGDARTTVARLIADVGPRPVWLGEATEDTLDAMTRLWFALAMGRGLGRHLAARVLTGPARTGSPPPPATSRRVTMVGRGRIGETLGGAFTRAGHRVDYVTRGPLGAGDIIVLALPGPAVEDYVHGHADALRGRLVIDAANIVGGAGPANSSAVITTMPDVRYARAFNTLGVENLLAPDFDGVPADMVFTSTTEDRGTVADLITAVGLRPVWLPAGAEHVVDGLLPLWFALARTHGRHLAFRVLTENRDL